jgi:epoxyqueuosine reductase
MDPSALARTAKAAALECGFDLAGVASADPPRELAFFRDWVERGYAGEMAYLSRQVDRRSDLRAALPWARSVLVVALQYDREQPRTADLPAGRGWISRYAWGEDYHEVVGERLRLVERLLLERIGPFRSRRYVDTGPLVERAFAVAAGLGAWGKNTCLLHPEHGSWLFLGELITDLEMAADAPRRDMCGRCTACLDACPTRAFPAPYVLDARRCISYLTIELKGAIPQELRAALGPHVFGCDICQDVCPWNRRRLRRGGEGFEPRAGLAGPDLAALAVLDDDAFRGRFRRSPIKRTKRRGLLRNVAVALGNVGTARHRAAVEALLGDAEPLVREHAAWALAQLDRRLGDGGGG